MSSNPKGQTIKLVSERTILAVTEYAERNKQRLVTEEKQLR